MKINIAIAAYVLSGIVAFGHSAANSSLDTERTAAAGILAAALSPLYWSWVFWEEVQ